MNEERIQKLYDDIKGEYNVGTIDDFKAYLSDSGSRKRFYDSVISERYNVGSIDEFETAYGLGDGGDPAKKSVPQDEKGSTSVSEESVSGQGEIPTDGGQESAIIEEPKPASNAEEVVANLIENPVVFQKPKLQDFAQEEIDKEFGEEKRREIARTEDVIQEEIGYVDDAIAEYEEKLSYQPSGQYTQEEINRLEAEYKSTYDMYSDLIDKRNSLAEERQAKRAERGSMIGAAYQEFGKGVLDIAEGAARFGTYLPIAGWQMSEEQRDKANKEISKYRKMLEIGMYANAALHPDALNQAAANTTKEYVENKYENGTLLDKAALSVVRSAPAMATGSAGLVLQSTAAGYDMVDQAAGDKLTNDEKMAYATSYGLVIGSLERLGLLGSFASKTKLGNYVNKVIQETAKRTGKLTESGVARIVKETAEPFIRASISEGSTEGIQEIAGAGMQEALNQIKDDQIFEDFDWNKVLNNAGESFLVGAIAGDMMVTPIAATRAAQVTAQEYEKLKKAVTPDMISDSIEIIDNKVKSGEITEEQAAEFKEDIVVARDIVSEIPSGLTDTQASEAFGLIKERKQLEAEIEGKDPNLTVPKQERIKEINQRLQEIVQPSEQTTEQDNKAQAQPTEGKVETEEDVQVSEVPVQEAPNIKMAFPNNNTLRKAKDFEGAVVERNRIKDEYKQLQAVMDCLWKS